MTQGFKRDSKCLTKSPTYQHLQFIWLIQVVARDTIQDITAVFNWRSCGRFIEISRYQTWGATSEERNFIKIIYQRKKSISWDFEVKLNQTIYSVGYIIKICNADMLNWTPIFCNSCVTWLLTSNFRTCFFSYLHLRRFWALLRTSEVSFYETKPCTHLHPAPFTSTQLILTSTQLVSASTQLSATPSTIFEPKYCR